MKHLVPTALVFLALASSAPIAEAQKPEDEVMKVINTLFEGMKKHDTTLMRSTLAPTVALVSTSNANGNPAVNSVPIANWLGSVARSTGELDERLSNPEVRVSDNLASVWVRYDFYVNGTRSHCGFNSFQLARATAGWKIIHVADSQRRENC